MTTTVGSNCGSTTCYLKKGSKKPNGQMQSNLDLRIPVGVSTKMTISFLECENGADCSGDCYEWESGKNALCVGKKRI